MYNHPGEYVTDFCIVERDNLYHLFHIRGERWTWPVGYRELDLGHATSSDLQHWIAHDPVLPSGTPGAWDEMGNWAPDIFEKDGRYYCYYTGSDTNNNQAIGLATSPDLFAWEKYAGNPVVVPGDWSDMHVGKDVAGRDAMVFEDKPNNRYLLFYTATMADGRACLAHAQSTDLIHWHDLGPTLIEEDRSYNRLESAYLVEHDGRFYLFYSAKGGPKSKGFSPSDFAHFDIVYVVGDSPTGPWTKPANHELLTEWTCASEHPTFNGTTYMLYIVQEEINGIWGASVMSDPKRIDWLADGTARICEHVPDHYISTPIYSLANDGLAGWVQHGGSWRVVDGQIAPPEGSGNCFLINPLWGTDLAFEAEIQLNSGSTASLLVRANPSAMAGYRIELDATQGSVRLLRMTPGQPELLLQQRNVKLNAGQWHKLKVVAQGAFFDIYVDDTLLIVRHERTYVDGCMGLHAKGNVRLRNVQAYRYQDLQESNNDWSIRCQPRHLFP